MDLWPRHQAVLNHPIERAWWISRHNWQPTCATGHEEASREGRLFGCLSFSLHLRLANNYNISAVRTTAGLAVGQSGSCFEIGLKAKGK